MDEATSLRAQLLVSVVAVYGRRAEFGRQFLLQLEVKETARDCPRGECHHPPAGVGEETS